MGRLAAGPIERLSREADRNPPVLENWDREGQRIDEVRFHASYEEMRRLAYGSGMIAGAYATPRDPHALTFGLGLLFSMAESGLYCPICMTDGAARVLERFAPPDLAGRYVPRLAAREAPFEGAMWLTERQGGSDVGANETRAREGLPPLGGRHKPPGRGGDVMGDHEDDRCFLLTGEKWFCSNLGSEVALVLARPEGAPAGTAGLGLFLVPLHLEDGSRNPGLRFRRLKDKLGTRSMPTGEVELDGAVAYLVAAPGAGFKAMAEMLNLSRLYNAVASCAGMRRAWVEAARHAAERRAFGRPLEDHPLHQEVVSDLAVECEAAMALTFEAVRRLDRVDAGSRDAEDRAILRALTPLAKLYTAKAAVRSASEAIEALGGNGYVEEQVTARLLRDAQVLPVWEGTTNILALDFLFRACAREGAHETLERFADSLLETAVHPALAKGREAAREAIAGARAGAEAALERGPEEGSRAARAVANAFARALEGALLFAEAERDLADDGDARGALLALRLLGTAPVLDRARYRSIVHCEPIDLAAATGYTRPSIVPPPTTVSP